MGRDTAAVDQRDEVVVVDAEYILTALGHDWLMLETYVKPYPCCRRLHSPIDAALGLREKLGDNIDAVERITVETNGESAKLDRKDVDSVAAAQMSIPYGVAAALVFGSPGLEHFEDAARRDPRVLRLAGKIEVRESDDPLTAHHRSAARVSLHMAGVTTSAAVTEPLGNPANPVDDTALTAKFFYLAEPVIGREAAMRLDEALWTLGEPPGSPGDRLNLLHELACPGVGGAAQAVAR